MTVTEPIETLARIQAASFARATEATQRAFPPERRMDGAALLDFLGRRRTGALATVRPDGRPHAAPVGFALVGTTFVIASLTDAARVRNLRFRPYASLVVTEGEGDSDGHAVVIAEGTARLISTPEAPLEMRAPFRDESGSMPAWIGMIVAITPERILSFGPPAGD